MGDAKRRKKVSHTFTHPPYPHPPIQKKRWWWRRNDRDGIVPWDTSPVMKEMIVLLYRYVGSRYIYPLIF